MVGGYYEHIVGAHIFKEFSETAVKLRQRFRVAVNIVPVPVEHIEIDEIDKAEPVEILILKSEGFLHAVGVVFVYPPVVRDAAGGKDIVYLADRYYIEARIFSLSSIVSPVGSREKSCLPEVL